MSTKPPKAHFVHYRTVKSKWRPFFQGMGTVLDIAPTTAKMRSIRNRIVHFDNPWANVGSDIFKAADALGTLRETSRHVIDLKVAHGDSSAVGRVFEFKSPKDGNCFVVVYDQGENGIRVVGTSEDETELPFDDYRPEEPVQADWVKETQRDY